MAARKESGSDGRCGSEGATPSGGPPGSNGDEFPLTDEHRMLLRIRDTLYEGSWEDFATDLRARADNKPHVFDVVPASPAVKSTIESHLGMIEAMQRWETERGRMLHSDGEPC